MTENFSELERTIVASTRARFATGVDEEVVAEAELVLADRFPPSYRWWLRKYGSGYLGGYELQGLAPVMPNARDPEEVYVGDVLCTWSANVRNGQPRNLLEIFNMEGDEIYYLDLANRCEDEAVVVCRRAETGSLAPAHLNFLDFLVAQV